MKSVVWLELQDAFDQGEIGLLPPPPAAAECCWPPSGMEELGDAIAWAANNGGEENRPLWEYYAGVWLAGRDQFEAALDVLATVETDESFALQGRLYCTIRKDWVSSRTAFSKISSIAWSLHPQVFIERDITLSHFGSSSLDERQRWFEQVSSLEDDGLTERYIHLLYDRGEYKEAKNLLDQTVFGKVHQRYKRNELWKKVVSALGMPVQQEPVPEHLGEDDLATYGAYRVTEQQEAE